MGDLLKAVEEHDGEPPTLSGLFTHFIPFLVCSQKNESDRTQMFIQAIACARTE